MVVKLTLDIVRDNGFIKPTFTVTSGIKLTLNIGREGGGIIPADKVRSGIKLLSAEGLNRVKR